ncbi:MAG: redox-regulated ATPase YchF [Pseudomonadota bacterium]
MGFQCGIVGLPNVGKSTLFNAITSTQVAESANYPFCTIEPNIGCVAVPDARLNEIAAIAQSQKVIHAQMTFVDIAGLVAGASSGEGLGNKFLANIREVDAICHVVRAFDDANIIHVDGSIDPMHDVDIINTELLLADMQSLENRIHALKKKSRGGDRESKELLALSEKLLGFCEEGKPLREFSYSDQEHNLLRHMQLLTTKPMFYVANVAEEDAQNGNDHVTRLQARTGQAPIIISALIEAEIAQFEDRTEQMAYLQDLGLAMSGLDRIITHGYALLNRITFFTAGPKEARAWSVVKGISARMAAGTIHTDFARGFIAAETIRYDDYITLQGEQAARDAGAMRLEGRDYIVTDGDIMLFRFNV